MYVCLRVYVCLYVCVCDCMQESKIADAENDLVRQLFKITIEKKMIQQPCRILPDQKINMG